MSSQGQGAIPQAPRTTHQAPRTPRAARSRASVAACARGDSCYYRDFPTMVPAFHVNLQPFASFCRSLLAMATPSVEELMLARERAAMHGEDLQSFLAQRYYTGSMQLRVQSGERLRSWQQLFEVWDGNYDRIRDAMREVRVALRARDWARVAEIVAAELSSSEEEGEEEEPESDAEMVPEALQQEIDSVLQPLAPARWFTGRVHKLDD